MIITYVGIVISAFLLLGCGISCVSSIFRLKSSVSHMKHYLYVSDMERKENELENERRVREEKLQENRIFQMDVRITHGSAFGGFCAVAPDGRHRRGRVSLDRIMMFGKNPAGRDFTYYIEEQDMDICATDEADTLKIISKDHPFEIRIASERRDQGSSVNEVLIHANVLYYIILESKHEISIQATANAATVNRQG